MFEHAFRVRYSQSECDPGISRTAQSVRYLAASFLQLYSTEYRDRDTQEREGITSDVGCVNM